jgi:hypothetical protein
MLPAHNGDKEWEQYINSSDLFHCACTLCKGPPSVRWLRWSDRLPKGWCRHDGTDYEHCCLDKCEYEEEGGRVGRRDILGFTLASSTATRIGKAAFFNCPSLTLGSPPEGVGGVPLGMSCVVEIGAYAFAVDDKLPEFGGIEDLSELPGTLRRLGECAFKGQSFSSLRGLEKTRITRVREFTFEGTPLETLEFLPPTLECVDRYAFS